MQAQSSSSEAGLSVTLSQFIQPPTQLAIDWYPVFADELKYTRLTPANTQLGIAQPQLVGRGKKYQISQ